MSDPFTIRIFVADGDPEGVRILSSSMFMKSSRRAPLSHSLIGFAQGALSGCFGAYSYPKTATHFSGIRSNAS